jgi:hypothetical protein
MAKVDAESMDRQIKAIRRARFGLVWVDIDEKAKTRGLSKRTMAETDNETARGRRDKREARNGQASDVSEEG